MDFATLFPDKREKSEDRLRQCQLVMIRMLKILDYLCTKHDIKYFLTGGSLLGAIRSNCIIPGDDDIDIGMTRDNYEKFVKYAVPELPPDIFFQSDETDPYFPSCHVIEAKLRDKYSSYVRNNTNKKLKFHDGLMVEIMVHDRSYLPNNYLVYALNRTLVYFFKNKQKGNQKRARILNLISKYTFFPLVYDSGFVIGRESIKMRKFFYRPKEISELIKIKFEDMETYIPIGWDEFLKRRYGDYMNDDRTRRHGIGMPDPFTPCDHREILHWKTEKKNIL